MRIEPADVPTEEKTESPPICASCATPEALETSPPELAASIRDAGYKKVSRMSADKVAPTPLASASRDQGVTATQAIESAETAEEKDEVCAASSLSEASH